MDHGKFLMKNILISLAVYNILFCLYAKFGYKY